MSGGSGPTHMQCDDAQEHGIPGSMEFKYMGRWELEEYLDCTRLKAHGDAAHMGDREVAFPCEPELLVQAQKGGASILNVTGPGFPAFSTNRND